VVDGHPGERGVGLGSHFSGAVAPGFPVTAVGCDLFEEVVEPGAECGVTLVGGIVNGVGSRRSAAAVR
jgi:hypothetical protein